MFIDVDASFFGHCLKFFFKLFCFSVMNSVLFCDCFFFIWDTVLALECVWAVVASHSWAWCLWSLQHFDCEVNIISPFEQCIVFVLDIDYPFDFFEVPESVNLEFDCIEVWVSEVYDDSLCSSL